MAEVGTGTRIGPYEIRSLLGRGGMGTVYLAQDHSLHRTVALKILPAHLSQDPQVVARFQREARSLAQVRHPNLMHIYTVGEHEDRPYFAMEHIRGSTLGAIMSKTGPLPPAKTVHITAEVLAALEKVHRAGIVHRDVKPNNIMIDEDGRAVLMDFGLARPEQGAPLTADHTVLGTPNYMSPEQARGQSVDHRTDLYSLGIVLYEMLTGAPPFKAKSAFEVLRKHIESTVPPPSAVRRDAPPELDVVVARAVAKSPEDRFQNAADMAAALSRLYEDPVLDAVVGSGDTTTEPTLLSPDRGMAFASTIDLRGLSPAGPGRWRGRTRRWLHLALAVAALLLVALLARQAFRPEPAPYTVEIRRAGAETVRGRLVAIEVLDDGTTTAKIVAEGSERERTISIRDGDELHIVRDDR